MRQECARTYLKRHNPTVCPWIAPFLVIADATVVVVVAAVLVVAADAAVGGAVADCWIAAMAITFVNHHDFLTVWSVWITFWLLFLLSTAISTLEATTSN